MDIKELLTVMKKLRTPETGCPWDLKQTFSTIVPYTIEEAYEVAEAIDNNDMSELKLELGDLLFQVVFYSRLAEEENHFKFDDVVEAIVEKMIRRHPHVFADTVYENDESFSLAWEQSKKDERNQKGSANESVLDGLTKALPALKGAQKMQAKVSKVGFDWKQLEPVYEKVHEELDEVREAQDKGRQDDVEDEIGDLLFSVVNLSRHLNIDAEEALRKATGKFENRFRQVESECQKQKVAIGDKSEAELIEMWEKVKREGV